MKPLFRVLSIVTGIVVVACLAVTARASESDQLTRFTFNAPVALPGVALPAGTYIFKHPDSVNDPHVVEVSSEDGRIIYGTFLTIPEDRVRSKDVPTVSFEETSAGQPEAIKAWFYPGRLTGEEFVYRMGQGARSADGA